MKLEPAPPLVKNLSTQILRGLLSPEMTAAFNKINEDYLYWDKMKYQEMPEGIKHSDVWTVVKLRRRNTPYQFSIGKYSFHWNLNSKLHGLLHFLDMNVGGSLELSTIVSREDKNRYLLSSIMEEAIASSQIEGAVTTRRQAKEMLRKNIKPRNHSEQMIHNNYVTIQKILELKSAPLSLSNFLEIHRLITTNTLGSKDEEGAIRDNDEIKVVDMVDGSVVHTPPQVSELPSLLEDLFKFFNEDDPKLFVHPIVKACVIHFLVAFIHPFTDGNGRTARALFYYYLLKKQYWLTEYLSISRLILKSKDSYAKAFLYSETDDNDLTYFIIYNIRTLRLAFDELRAYIIRKNEEKKQITDLLGIDGLTYRQALILEWFREERGMLLTIGETAKRLGVSYMTARTDLNELVQKQYIEIRNLNRVSKGYVRGPKLDDLLDSR